MSRDEALTAVLNAARLLQGAHPVPQEAHPTGQLVGAALLAQLYAAVEAVDAVDGAAAVRPGFCQAADDCWMLPMVPGGTCYAHSEIAQKPHPWERAGLRRGVFAVSEESDDGARPR